MKKNTKKILITAAVGIVSGTLLKLNGQINIGDAVMGISSLIWLYIIGSYVLKYLNRNRRV